MENNKLAMQPDVCNAHVLVAHTKHVLIAHTKQQATFSLAYHYTMQCRNTPGCQLFHSKRRPPGPLSSTLLSPAMPETKFAPFPSYFPAAAIAFLAICNQYAVQGRAILWDQCM